MPRLARSTALSLAALVLLLACEPERTTTAPPLAASRRDDDRGLIFRTPNRTGVLGTVSLTGTIDRGSEFFQSLGTNGRSCATCHLQDDAFGLSAASARSIFAATGGRDPLFAPVDGANCADAPSRNAASRSLLLNNGLIRIALNIPATADFSVSVVRDPYGCALRGDTVSVYRRPLPTANLSFLSTIMFDGRESLQPLNDRATFTDRLRSNLLHQAQSATTGHAQATGTLSAGQLNAIVDFELALFTAQQVDNDAGRLTAENATGGPMALARTSYFPGINDVLGGDPTGAAFTPSAFTLFDTWRTLRGSGQEDRARRAVARGQVVFNTHPLTITNVAGLNDGLGIASIPGTCTTCHDTPNVGDHSLPLPLDIGVSHVAGREPDGRVAGGVAMLSQPDLPVFQVTCTGGPLAGTVRFTSDPGRALISGKCADLGRVKGPILRALSGRAPFFHNGAAANLTQVVEFYNARFQMGMSDQERRDLLAFLQTL